MYEELTRALPTPDSPHWKYEDLPEKFRKEFEKHAFGGAYEYYEETNGFWYKNPNWFPPPTIFDVLAGRFQK